MSEMRTVEAPPAYSSASGSSANPVPPEKGSYRAQNEYVEPEEQVRTAQGTLVYSERGHTSTLRPPSQTLHAAPGSSTLQYPQPSPQISQSTPAQSLPLVPSDFRSDVQLGQDFQAGLYAKCARGEHSISKKYGVVGIITAICCFPCGLICLCMDVEKKCTRCGYIEP